MFARRKKPREDDEPLVPHGLIWQATGETPSEDPPSPMPAEPRISDPVEMPVRASETSAPEIADTSNPSPVMPPPLGWPRVAGDEVNRRARTIDTAVSFPYRKGPMPAVKPPATNASPVPAASSRPTLVPKEPVRFSLPTLPKLKVAQLKEAASVWAKITHSFAATV